jgi:hypothetical protein
MQARILPPIPNATKALITTLDRGHRLTSPKGITPNRD